jgi:carbamoyl-phosphate synthase small subunit
VHIGNYGTLKKEAESEKVQISGLVCRNFTNEYSRILADSEIQTYLEDNKIVCIYDVDTRAIVRSIRDKGAMNCIISSEILDISVLKAKLDAIPDMEGLELASKVSTHAIYELGNPSSPHKVAVLDFGTKQNILQCLIERDCYVRVFPAKSTLDTMLDFQPDGFFLSNGPGDPAAMTYAIQTAKEILATGKPVFGICLGHQILALANHIATYKMHHGHRGANHPVINLQTGKCEVTSQNHGFSVREDDLQQYTDTIEITHRNLNDGTIEGIRMKNIPAFSVQYHPEANPGPHDSRYLFDDFVNLIIQAKQKTA